MARKKELIQKEWTTAQDSLTDALMAADKAKEKGTLTQKDCEGAQAKYDLWKKLLNESITKIADWKNEKDKKRLEWMKFVETQKTKTDRNYIAKIQNLWTGSTDILKETAARQAALDDLLAVYKVGMGGKIDGAKKALLETATAIQKKDSFTALQKHGAALNYLKEATGMTTLVGMKKQAGIYAANHKVSVNDMNLKDPELKSEMAKLTKVYKEIQAKIEELDPAIEELAVAHANKEPETTSTDPVYKKNLNEIVTDYKAVLVVAAQGLTVTKKLQGDAKKLTGIVPQAKKEAADKYAEAALKIFTTLEKAYHHVDSHIQKTIRTTESTITKKKNSYRSRNRIS